MKLYHVGPCNLDFAVAVSPEAVSCWTMQFSLCCDCVRIFHVPICCAVSVLVCPCNLGFHNFEERHMIGSPQDMQWDKGSVFVLSRGREL